MRILIVDDQRSVRLATAHGLRADGHEVDTADSGAVALLKLKDERFELVVLDLHIEGKADGLDCLAKMQKIAPETYVCLISNSELF